MLCHRALNKFYAAISATNAIAPTSTRSFLANFFFLAIKLPTLIFFSNVFFVFKKQVRYRKNALSFCFIKMRLIVRSALRMKINALEDVY